MADQNIAESVQIRAAEEVFWAIKRHTGGDNYFCASATVKTLEPYNLKCFDVTDDQTYAAFKRNRREDKAQKHT